MTTLISNASANFTGAATFGAAEIGAGALTLMRNTTNSLGSASSFTSATFTVTNAKIIDGCLLFIKTSGTTGTGTFKVDLQKGGVSQASVTVNKSDLPDSTNTVTFGCPMFFKFTGTATGDGGSNWTIVLTSTSGTGSATVTVAYTNVGSQITKALRTTTAATAAAADDIYVVGEMTGAATHNALTVTMNSTAATAYGSGALNSTTVAGGGIHVSGYGTLTYGNTAATNYVLRINGDMFVWQFGTLNIGTTVGSAEIPRDSTAVLEFQQTSADGDFGLRLEANSVTNIAGLSRTSGKNVVKCLLTADVISANLINGGNNNVSSTVTAASGVNHSGTSLLGTGLTDTAAASTHSVSYSAPSVSNTTQTARVWVARGSGTNNRFMRVTVGDNSSQASVTNGFYSDIDMQAGTAGTVTAMGNGTATSVSISAFGGGFIVTITGKVSSGSATPNVILNSNAAAGTMSYTGAGNQAFIYDRLVLLTAASISDTTINVNTDTGWKSGDVVLLLPTQRSYSEGETYTLNADAGASSMTSPLYPFGSHSTLATSTSRHSGTAPSQGHACLTTRNVKIRSTSSSLMTYIYMTALATVTMQWAEVYYIGVNSNNKHGVEIDTGVTASAKSITYCSIHDSEMLLLWSTGGSTSFNLTFSNNVLWNGTAGHVQVQSAIINTDWTMDNNIVVGRGGGKCFDMNDCGGTFTNNIAAGGGTGGNDGIIFSESSATFGTFSGNTAYCNSNNGFSFSGTAQKGTLDTITSWRNGGGGIAITGSQWSEAVLSNMTVFGNTNSNIPLSGSAVITITGTNVVAGDASFATTHGFSFAANVITILNTGTLDMSGSGTGLASHSSDDFNFTTQTVQATLNNYKPGTVSLFTSGSRSQWSTKTSFRFEKYGQTAGDHRTEMTYGQLKTDTVIFNSASPSMRMTPNSATFKLESAPSGLGIVAAVANGGTVSVSVNVRKSVVGDGTAYNGNQPRLMQRANPSLGQDTDVLLATNSNAAGSFAQLTATSSTATDDGAFEFFVDCDGTTGWVNVDDWAVA